MIKRILNLIADLVKNNEREFVGEFKEAEMIWHLPTDDII